MTQNPGVNQKNGEAKEKQNTKNHPLQKKKEKEKKLSSLACDSSVPNLENVNNASQLYLWCNRQTWKNKIPKLLTG